MTDTIEITTAVEHGVRYTWPGDGKEQVVACDDLDCALALMDVLAGEGVTAMEPVTRAVPGWRINPRGLPAAVRHLAEARVDEQLDDRDVRVRLAMWLADGGQYGIDVVRGWQDLLLAIRAHREAEDGPLEQDADREQLVGDTEARITAAVQRIVGGES